MRRGVYVGLVGCRRLTHPGQSICSRKYVQRSSYLLVRQAYAVQHTRDVGEKIVISKGKGVREKSRVEGRSWSQV